jgi:hypothetical protein
VPGDTLAVDYDARHVAASVRRPDGQTTPLHLADPAALPAYRDQSDPEHLRGTLRAVHDLAVSGGSIPAALAIAHPPGWPAGRGRQLTEAAGKAGLPKPALFAAPEAAAASIDFERAVSPADGGCLVYDLDAGHATITLLRHQDLRWSAGTVAGVPDAGVDALDAAIVAVLARTLRDTAPGRPRLSRAGERRQQELLVAHMPELRRALSRGGSGQVPVVAGGATVMVTRAEVERAIGQVLAPTVHALRSMLAGARNEAIGTVVLTGEAAHTPGLALLLRHATGLTPVVLGSPGLVVDGLLRMTPVPTGPAAPRRTWLGWRRRQETMVIQPVPQQASPVSAPPMAQPAHPGPVPRQVTAQVIWPRYTHPVQGPLASGSRYLLRLAISADGARPPDHFAAPEPGWWLEVVATGVRVSTERHPAPFFLPVRGAAFRCPCRPREPHRCAPTERVPWLDLGFTTTATGTATIQMVIYHGAAVLRVLRVSLAVGEFGPSPSTEVAFATDLTMADPGRYADRALSLLVDATAGGGLEVRVADGHGGYLSADLPGGALDGALDDLREVVRRPAGGAELRQLALVGRAAFEVLIPDPRHQARLRGRLASAARRLERPPVVQIVGLGEHRLDLPWQLVYDLPFTVDSPACPSMDLYGPGAPPGEPPQRCPYEERHDGPGGVLCPYGFWGLAYLIEEQHGIDPPRVTGTASPPTLLVARNRTVDDGGWPARRRALARISGAAGVVVVTDTGTLRTGLQDGVDLLYVLCPGSAPGEMQFSAADRLTVAEVASWSQIGAAGRRRGRRPLVLLAAGEPGPDMVAGLITGLGAAGVLAAEVAFGRDLAGDAMEAFLSGLYTGDSMGTALRRMRWELLARHSLAGLAYTPYGCIDLRVPSRVRGVVTVPK